MAIAFQSSQTTKFNNGTIYTKPWRWIHEVINSPSVLSQDQTPFRWAIYHLYMKVNKQSPGLPDESTRGISLNNWNKCQRDTRILHEGQLHTEEPIDCQTVARSKKPLFPDGRASRALSLPGYNTQRSECTRANRWFRGWCIPDASFLADATSGSHRHCCLDVAQGPDTNTWSGESTVNTGETRLFTFHTESQKMGWANPPTSFAHLPLLPSPPEIEALSKHCSQVSIDTQK